MDQDARICLDIDVNSKCHLLANIYQRILNAVKCFGIKEQGCVLS